MSGKRQFKYVYIPCDSSEEMEERVMKYDDKTEVSCLTDAFQEQARKQSATASKEEQRALFTQHLAQNLKEKGQESLISSMNDNMINMFMNMETVDIVALLPNSPKFDYIGVNMYVDDKGSSKMLPVNPRATEIAQRCGVNTNVRGDCFISRARETTGDEYSRMDFTLKELSSASASPNWMDLARDFHLGGGYSGSASGIDNGSVTVSGSVREGGCEKFGCENDGKMRCGRCKVARYCSRDCQKIAWGGHKLVCGKK
mmetsp:Transcript_418/g.705  ORF Transcript_418/g.705 Transcript_418/m.705 type:complete len:257 (-) Transcript_418:123-893(-)|eukprot:CAMPEP_0201525394 /NCGR_PEP_ID=MMETSP0161_2-20130828/28092_1 /ASSEMBLY_ACC=CAM_ASM_000251 /TAXON_ID=180227 /ORGANISM="Neoparamoeba aestuarina, Strain SoJaBio B1-5/56/2" /LENGTH=256 /DNA_ID=CAMNT_0047925295 /DNA_START=36 /DNA_END=806 /DNA_ORIENTATION=-